MIPERLAVGLDTMHGAASKAVSFIEGMSREQFLIDEKTQAATVMMLITIGETAGRISEDFPEFVAEHDTWPWQQMRAMRNRGAHAYDTIVFEVIWDTVTVHVPPLISAIEGLGPLGSEDAP